MNIRNKDIIVFVKSLKIIDAVLANILLFRRKGFDKSQRKMGFNIIISSGKLLCIFYWIRPTFAPSDVP